jgi:uncharacterized membrane protein YebE (DUF533 family)
MSFIFNEDDMKFISQEQKGAVITACVAAAMADGTINKEEVARMSQEFLKIPWGIPLQLVTEVADQAQKKLGELKDAAGVMSYIQRTAAFLPPGPIREKTLYLIASVMLADKNLDQGETVVLTAFAEAFAIPQDRLQAIATAVRSQ